MSHPVPSRALGINSFVVPGGPTLAAVIEAINASSHLDPQARADLASAVRAVARTLGLPPGDVPAHPGFLGQRVAKVGPAAHGLTPSRWANIKSLLRRALNLAGVSTMPGRYLAPLSPAWSGLRRQIPDRGTKLGLSRLMHFCSAEKIEPEDVDDSVLERYRQALELEAVVKNPRAIWRDSLTFWNRAVGRVPGWPPRTLSVPVQSGRYGLPMDAFPPSFAADAEAWLTRLEGKQFLLETGFKPIRPATLGHRRRQLMELSSALVCRGRDPSTFRSLADLVQPAAVREAMRYFHERAGRRCTARMLVFCRVIISIAKHWVKLGDEQLDELRAIARQCDPGTRGMTPKNQAILRCFSSPAAKEKLVELPFTLLRELKAPKPWQGYDARKVETALIVQLLLRAPMRLGNLANLRLDEHVMQPEGSNGPLLLVIPAPETKNNLEVVYPLLGATRDLWQLYVEAARPQLALRPTPYLSPSSDGSDRPRSSRAIQKQVGKVTFRQLGIRLTPHQFRHLAGKLVLDARPGAHELVRALLGHRSITTTLRYYAGLEQESAAQHYDEVIEQIRSTAGRMR
jgi:integrase